MPPALRSEMKRILLVLLVVFTVPFTIHAQSNVSGGSSGSSTSNGSIGAVFNVLNYGWIDDDSTDNCGAPVTNFLAAVNGYAGPGIAQVIIPEGTGQKAYKLSTCNLIFTQPRTIYLWGTLDCAQSAAFANCIQEGPSNLANFTNAQTPPYTIDGTGVITGCANVTVACIEAEPWVSNPRVKHIHMANVGAGNAALNACTNYAVSFDGHNNAPQIIGTEYWNTDATTGRCWSINNRTSAGGGTNTALIAHNTIIGAGNAPNFLTPCGAIGHTELGSATMIFDNQFYGFGQPLLMLNPQTNTDVRGNLIDQAGCTTGVASADIHMGNASNGAVVGVSIVDNYFPGGAGHATNAMSISNGSTSTITDISFLGNRSSNGQTKGLFSSTTGCLGECFAYGNSDFTFPIGTGASKWNVGAVAKPIYPVGNSGNTGIWSSATNNIDFTVNGTNILNVGNTFAWIQNANGLAIGASSNSWLSCPSSGNCEVGIGAQTSTGTWKAKAYLTDTNCAVNSASPAACGSAASGVFAVPTTTTTYTVNSTAVTANSRIFIQDITDNTGIPSAPTCTALATFGDGQISGRVAGTSFTFALPSTAGTTCFSYWIVN